VDVAIGAAVGAAFVGMGAALFVTQKRSNAGKIDDTIQRVEAERNHQSTSSSSMQIIAPIEI
jgi:hypothetical protein